MRALALTILLWATSVWASPLPPNAATALPLLDKTVNEVWPEFKHRAEMAGQTERETCTSLKSKTCMTERAELKRPREYGFGFAQLTITYRKDGTERFNTFKDLKKYDKAFKDWKFEDRFNRDLQMRALVVLDKRNYYLIKGAATDRDRRAMMFVSHNAGLGRVLSNRKLCADERTFKCDPSRWFGHAEKTSYLKDVKKVQGYGKSFYEISFDYPRDIMFVRSVKYRPYFSEQGETP